MDLFAGADADSKRSMSDAAAWEARIRPDLAAVRQALRDAGVDGDEHLLGETAQVGEELATRISLGEAGGRVGLVVRFTLALDPRGQVREQGRGGVAG